MEGGERSRLGYVDETKRSTPTCAKEDKHGNNTYDLNFDSNDVKFDILK